MFASISTAQRVLVVGAGSGRDMAHATFVVDQLRHIPHVDLAGFLTPWSKHLLDGMLERPINAMPKTLRKIALNGRRPETRKSFEQLLPTLCAQQNIPVHSFFLFSLHHEYAILQDALQQFVDEHAYDAIILVDVGGDILSTDADLPLLCTPIVDQTCLQLFTSIQIATPRLLTVLAPGVDGELPAHVIQKHLATLTGTGAVVASCDNIFSLSAFHAMTTINTAIDLELHTKSYTGTVLERVGTETQESLTASFKAPYRIVRLSTAIAKSCFVFDLAKAKKYIGISTRFTTLEETNQKLQTVCAATEMDFATPVSQNE